MADRAPRILIADGGTILQMSRREFQIEGYEAAESADCKSLLEVAASWPPVVVFVDVEMPTGEGWSCLEQVLAADQMQHATVIAVVSSEADARRAADKGARQTLMKPFGPITLLQAVREAFLDAGWTQADLEHALRARRPGPR